DCPEGPLGYLGHEVEYVEVDGCLRVRACGDGDLVGGCGPQPAECVLEVGPVSGDVVEVVAGVECAHGASASCCSNDEAPVHPQVHSSYGPRSSVVQSTRAASVWVVIVSPRGRSPSGSVRP